LPARHPRQLRRFFQNESMAPANAMRALRIKTPGIILRYTGGDLIPAVVFATK
jgi:hypothetical protein